MAFVQPQSATLFRSHAQNTRYRLAERPSKVQYHRNVRSGRRHGIRMSTNEKPNDTTETLDASPQKCLSTMLTPQQVCAAAARRGIVMEDTSTGPFIQFRAAWAGDGGHAGAISGAMLPGRRLHIESYRAAARVSNGPLLRLSPGMLLFIAAIAKAHQRGCSAVYGLAIDDDPQQHERLVRYLEHFGGEKVRFVGESIRDIPDRLVYGGRGTIIRGDISAMLARGGHMIARTSR